jgi:hypothetical protein
MSINQSTSKQPKKLKKLKSKRPNDGTAVANNDMIDEPTNPQFQLPTTSAPKLKVNFAEYSRL